MTFVADILRNMSDLNKSRRDFMLLLFQLMLSIPGRMTFRNLSRYSELSERTFIVPFQALRHYDQGFDFACFKRNLRLAYLLDRRKPDKPRYVVLFSTDLNLDVWTIVEYYRLRFGIEFTGPGPGPFRDAKPYTGLAHCQSRQRQRLQFHFNASRAVGDVPSPNGPCRH
jgi:hypothetical protein